MSNGPFSVSRRLWPSHRRVLPSDHQIVLSLADPLTHVTNLHWLPIPCAELANFQGYYQCDKRVKVGRPSTVEEAQSLVSMFPHVKASGVGHSWWKEQFCSGADDKSINLVMTELKPTVDL
jgi:hypothetical protein